MACGLQFAHPWAIRLSQQMSVLVMVMKAIVLVVVVIVFVQLIYLVSSGGLAHRYHHWHISEVTVRPADKIANRCVIAVSVVSLVCMYVQQQLIYNGLRRKYDRKHFEYMYMSVLMVSIRAIGAGQLGAPTPPGWPL